MWVLYLFLVAITWQDVTGVDANEGRLRKREFAEHDNRQRLFQSQQEDQRVKKVAPEIDAEEDMFGPLLDVLIEEGMSFPTESPTSMPTNFPSTMPTSPPSGKPCKFFWFALSSHYPSPTHVLLFSHEYTPNS